MQPLSRPVVEWSFVDSGLQAMFEVNGVVHAVTIPWGHVFLAVVIAGGIEGWKAMLSDPTPFAP